MSMRIPRLPKRAAYIATTVGLSAVLSACAGAPSPQLSASSPSGAHGNRPRAYNRPYEVLGRWYTPHEEPAYDRVGLASWYSYESPSRTTADGEPFDVRLATAAHTTLPIPSWLEVTNLANGRSERVRLNDRGPFRADRIIDLSRGAAQDLGFLQQGIARVRVRYLGPAAPLGGSQPVWARREPLRWAPFLPVSPVPAPHVVAPVYATLAPSPSARTLGNPAAEVAEDDVQDQPPAPAPDPGASETLLIDSRDMSDGQGFEVQAAAFADRANAERAAARLAQAGSASIRPLQHGDVTLYRVIVGPWPQAGLAIVARRQVAAMGFTDAKVISR